MSQDQHADGPEVWDQNIPVLDEPIWRRDGWISYRSAKLADAQVWAFPRIGLAEALAIPRFADLFARFPTIETDDPADVRFWNQQFQIDAVYRNLAARLLLLGYEITADQANALTAHPLLYQAELTQAIRECLIGECLIGDDPSVIIPEWFLLVGAMNDGPLFRN